MLHLLICLALIFFATWLFLKWRRVKNFWADRGVPHKRPNPVFGSLTFLQRENPSDWMVKIYNEFKAPYVGVWAFWRPGLIVNDPELAKNILVKDHDVFRNRFLSSGKTDPIGGLNLFTVNDPTWSFVRRRLTTIFTAAKLRSLNNLVAGKASDLVNRIRQEMKNGKTVNLRVLAVDYTTDVIGEAAFGISSEAAKTGDSAIRRITRELMGFSLHRGLCWSSIFFFPELVDIFRFSLFPKGCMDDLRNIFRSIIRQRGGYDKEIKESRDLLDALLKIRQEALADNEEISEDLLLAQAAIFLVGGFDSSAVILTWCLYELAWNPTYQERLYEEVLEAKKKIGDRPFDVGMLSELTYLNCVIKESLRKYTPMGWFDRIASKDYQIDDKLTIPAGTIVYVNAMGMQQDPKYFPDPMTFEPDRFLPENAKNIEPYVYMPFGEGPRMCIGKRFAFQQIRCGLANVILNFGLKLLPGATHPNEIEMEKHGMFYTPVGKMSLDFVLRESNLFLSLIIINNKYKQVEAFAQKFNTPMG